MRFDIGAALRGIGDHFERRAYLKRLQRLDDHLLDDIGLRRDQLDILILHPPMAPIRDAGLPGRLPAPQPFLQGCG